MGITRTDSRDVSDLDSAYSARGCRLLNERCRVKCQHDTAIAQLCRARYACGEHRGELKAELRESYGTLGWHPWAMGPHPVNYRRGRVAARRALGPGRPSRWSPLA